MGGVYLNMENPSLEEVLREHGDPIELLRTSDVLDEPTPAGRDHPREFTNWLDEQLSWKETCYIGDWSFMPDLHVRGPDALELLSDLTVNSLERFPVGQAKHAIQCNQDGQVIGDGILYRLAADEYRTQHLAAWPKFNAETDGYDVTAEIHDSFIYQVQGPTSLQVLEALTDESLRDIGFMNVETIEIEGVEVVILRQGMSGEVGFELQGPREHGEAIWDAVVEAGEEEGLRRLGRRSHMINHLEMCFPTRGHHYLPAIFGDELRAYRKWLDADNYAEANFTVAGSYRPDDVSGYYRSPVELGWERNIAFDHEFIGREALEAEVDSPRRTIVTLVWDPDDVADVFASFFREGKHHKYLEMPYQPYRGIEADVVRHDGEAVGVSTGRGYSYYYREMLSLCTVDIEYSEPGTEVVVVWGEGRAPPNPKIQPHVPKEITATVARAPYKEDRRRTDLHRVGTG